LIETNFIKYCPASKVEREGIKIGQAQISVVLRLGANGGSRISCC
jgi:hypothetical protein